MSFPIPSDLTAFAMAGLQDLLKVTAAELTTLRASVPDPEAIDDETLTRITDLHAIVGASKPDRIALEKGIQNSRNEARWDPAGTPAANPHKKLAGTRRYRPSLNREASRLGDVRIRRPSFRAQVPETCSRLCGPGNSSRCSIALN